MLSMVSAPYSLLMMWKMEPGLPWPMVALSRIPERRLPRSISILISSGSYLINGAYWVMYSWGFLPV